MLTLSVGVVKDRRRDLHGQRVAARQCRVDRVTGALSPAGHQAQRDRMAQAGAEVAGRDVTAHRCGVAGSADELRAFRDYGSAVAGQQADPLLAVPAQAIRALKRPLAEKVLVL